MKSYLSYSLAFTLFTFSGIALSGGVKLSGIDCSVPFELDKKISVSQGNNACSARRNYQPCAANIVKALKGNEPLFAIGGPVKRCIWNKAKKFPNGLNRFEWYQQTKKSCKTRNWINKKALAKLTESEKDKYNAGPSNHSFGTAVDVYVNKTNSKGKKIPPVDYCKEAGDNIRDWALNNADSYGITEIFWNKKSYTSSKNWKEKSLPKKKDHYDHVHLSCTNPKGGKLKQLKDQLKQDCKDFKKPGAAKDEPSSSSASPTKEPKEPKEKKPVKTNVTAASTGSDLNTDAAPNDSSNADAASRVSSNEFGLICYNFKGFKKQIVSEKEIVSGDVIWLARMIHGETRGKATTQESKAMLWALIQAQYVTTPKLRKRTLGEYAQRYSQPINKIWLKTGPKCRSFYTTGKFVPTSSKRSKLCDTKIVEKRERFRRMKWEAISTTIRNTAIEFATGQIDNNGIGEVGWYAKGTWNGRQRNGMNKKESKIASRTIQKNVFYMINSKIDTSKWDGTEITVAGPNENCPIVKTESQPSKKGTSKKKTLDNPF